MRVGYIVDHPKRDMPGGVMFARALVERGAEAVLVPLYEQAVDIPLLALDALVVNFARPVNLELVRAYADTGVPVWVIDTEGGVLTKHGGNSPQALASYVKQSGYADVLAGYFFWGSELHDAFVQHSGMPAERLHLSGCPRFDYAAARWRDLLVFERSGYVLVNANFSLVNPMFSRSPEAEVGSLVAAGWQEQYVHQLLADQRQIFREFVETIEQLFSAQPQRQFLLRPHPFENADFYRERFARFPNVVVDGAGSVLNVIHHAEAILHLNCGTSVEAVLLDKLPLSMEFLNTEFMRHHGPLPSQVSAPVASFPELLQAISDIPAATRAFPFEQRHQQHIAPWFHLNDGAAADRMAEVILEHLRRHGAPARQPSVARSLASSRHGSRVGQRAQALMSNLAGSRFTAEQRARFQAKRRDKLFDLATIRAQCQAMAQHAGMPGIEVDWARHPWTGVKLASVIITP